MKCRAGSATAVLSKSFVCLGILFLFLFSIWSCQPKTSYKTLSFFFDGVPNPEEEMVQKNGQPGVPSTNKKPTYKMHGPYAAKLCSACHQPGTNMLILPVEKLCMNCHVLQLDKKFVHGPVAAGGCKVCHDPHGSSYRYLLVAEAREFCLRCHSEKDIAKNKAHDGVTADCTDCHDAHTSNRRYMLK